jgi:acyl-coenzyme A thioesterase PaaI-like protein
MREEDLIEQYTQDGWTLIEDSGYVGLVGPYFYREDALGLRFCFPTLVKHLNRNGVIHGGALMTFVDRVCGMSVRHSTQTLQTATVQLSYNFIDAVKAGEVVTTTPQITREAAQIVFISARLKVRDRVVAEVTGIWKKAKPQSPIETPVPSPP